jgi:hypothetical protein
MAYTPMRHKVLDTKSLGDNWGMVLQDMVEGAGTKRAHAVLKRAKIADGPVEVQIPVFLHLIFASTGGAISGPPTIACACTYSEDEHGSVCICTGPGAADCDCGAIVV